MKPHITERRGGEQMKVIASFVGRNKDFKAWLAAGMPNVICLAEYREKKKTVSKKDGHEKENQLN